MSAITTHVLDTARGRPAAGMTVVLDRLDGGQWQRVAQGATDDDGRLRTLMPEESRTEPGTYRLVFDTAQYFRRVGASAFYPRVTLEFETAGDAHYHVPLLISPFGYSTYRGT